MNVSEAPAGVSADIVDDGASTIRNKILNCLGIYNRISPSMLQIGIGTSLPPKIWHPVLDDLIQSGLVVREEVKSNTLSGRPKQSVVLSLKAA